MGSNTAAVLFAAQQRAINRTLYHLRVGLKKARDSLLNEGGVDPESISIMQNGMLKGMYTAFLFARVYELGKIYKETKSLPKNFSESEFFADMPLTEPLSVLELCFKYDGRILRSLAASKFLYNVIRDKEFYSVYFMPNEKVIAHLNQYTFNLAHVEGEDMTELIQEVFRKGNIAGESTDVIAKMINEKIESLSRNRAKAISETETTRAYTVGFLQETYNDENICGYKFSTVNDSHRTKMCEVREGLYIPKEDVDLVASNSPPLHVRCRSMLKSVYIWEEIPEHITNVIKDFPSKQRDEDIAFFKELITTM